MRGHIRVEYDPPAPGGQHDMGQATRTGGMLLVSMLSLACNHERVNLGETGVGGSAPSSPIPFIADAGRAQENRVPAAPVPRPMQPALIAVPGPPQNPGPSPLLGLTMRDALVPPISGGSLAVAADGSIAVAADADHDEVSLLRLKVNAISTLTLPTGSEPGRVVLDDHGQAHVLLRSAGQLARIQLNPGTFELSEPICQYPRGLAYSAASRTLHVACADGQLIQLDADSYRVIARERHANDLRDVIIGANDMPVVSRFRSAGLLWQGAAGWVESQPATLPWPKVDLSAPSASQVSSVSTRATFAHRTVATPDGTLWMLHERAQRDALQDGHYGGPDKLCGPAVQPALTHFSGMTQPTAIDSLQLLGLAAPAVDLAISPDGRFIAIATPAAYAQRRASVQLHLVDALKQAARIPQPESNSEFPKPPSELCARAAFATFGPESQAIAVAFDTDNVLYVQNRFPGRLDIIKAIDRNGSPEIGLHRSLPLNNQDVRDLGHEWFHAEHADSGVSCAACHADGLDDGHTWQSEAKGPRRTPSLRGGLLQTAPYAWDGEFSSAESMFAEIVHDRLGSHDLPAEAATALAHWLDKLPAFSLHPEPAADSGKSLFESAELGCTSCHSGPKLTNNQTLDVGTGGAFQVPSLLGLGMRAPYMHDGCAKDLNALFTQPDCARQGHAQLTKLDAEQAANLLAYLQSL